MKTRQAQSITATMYSSRRNMVAFDGDRHTPFLFKSTPKMTYFSPVYEFCKRLNTPWNEYGNKKRQDLTVLPFL
jgi:hypothetical protein